MANALVTIEERLYTERGAVGGDGWQEWEVVSRAEETPDVASPLLRPADGRPTLAFRAGQCVSVQVELAHGARQIREYGLTGAPSAATRSITVKRVRGTGTTPDGEVSRHLHGHVREGDLLRVSAPYGGLVLAADGAPLLLASAGIGCTPVLAVLEELVDARHEGPVTSCTPTAPPARTRCAPRTRRSPPNSRTPQATSGTRSPVRAAAPAGPTSPTCRSPPAPAPTSAAPCPSCARCASSCSVRVWRRPTSTTRCSAPNCGSPRREQVSRAAAHPGMVVPVRRGERVAEPVALPRD